MLVNLTILSIIEQISKRDKVLDYFKCFLDYLQLGLLTTEDAEAENIDAKSTFIKKICIGNINAIEYSKIYLQSFQILKIRDMEIKIQVRAS